MCGIAGVFDLAGRASVADVEAMVATLRHRGPDSWGIHRGNLGVIGQTRLAVIDLVTGDPPITDDSGQIGVSLNGEIYNYRALREQTRDRGHRLATSGDTEVIALLAADLDPVPLADALDGMFAAAVLDDRRGRLLLLRDRIGKKPLYYWTGGGKVVYGSEIKTLLAHPDVPRELDPHAIPAYLTFGYVPTPSTFFAGIKSVPPGHVLVADGDGVRLLQYWAPAGPGAHDVSELDLRPAEAARQCRELLGDAVGRRMVADVPLGAFLSGGIDSSAIVALMAERSTQPVKTFSIGFENAGPYDERRFAKIVADRFRTDHHEFVVRPGEVDLVEQLAWHMDQPFADASSLPTYLLSELTKQHVTVALSGDGGDEVFAGYERFLASMVADRYQRIPRPLRQGAASATGLLPSRGITNKVKRFLDRADLGMPDALRSWISYVPEEIVDRLLGAPDHWALDAYRSSWRQSEGGATLNRILHLNITTYLLDDLLPKVDRMSMAHGLEVRSPFLDPQVVSFGLRLPARLQVRRLTTKRVLKDSMRGLVPDEILDRGKRGFGVPLDQWFRGDLRTYLDAKLGPGTALREHLKGDAIDDLIAEHHAGIDRAGALWSLLMLGTFLEREGW